MAIWEVCVFRDELDGLYPVAEFEDPDETTARNKARWWAINWMKAGYVPVHPKRTPDNQLPPDTDIEVYMPTAAAKLVAIREQTAAADLPDDFVT